MSSSDTGSETDESIASDLKKPGSEPLSAQNPETVPGKRTNRVLALDTALGACSAAVFDPDRNEAILVHSIELARGHAEALMPMIERVMLESGTSFADLGRIVTTIGPGSFTGLRVAIAAARGLALASDKPAVGVSTLAAFSEPYITTKDTIPVVAAIDALHGNIFFQMIGAAGRVLISPRLGNLEQTVRSVAVGPVRLVGPGAKLLASRWPVNMPAPVLVDARIAPDIVWVARIGASANPDTAKPKPLYLKAPDAQPQTAHRLPHQ